MRINQAKRIYMNEADAGSGNGAAPVAAVPAEPAAQPASETSPADAIKSAVGEMLTGFRAEMNSWRNGFFADARRAGAIKQDKPASEPQTQPTQPTPSAPAQAQAGLSMADVEALLERKGVVATRSAKYGLSESQVRRFESAMASVPRESLASEADSYLADMGLSAAKPQATQPVTQAPAQPAKPNVSDRGTAAPTDTRDFEGVLNSRPLEMTKHDLDALKLKHGDTKGLMLFQERVLSALRGVRIKPPRG